MYECFAHVYVYVPHACLCPQRTEEGTEFPGTRDIDGYNLQRGYWEPHPGL